MTSLFRVWPSSWAGRSVAETEAAALEGLVEAAGVGADERSPVDGLLEAHEVVVVPAADLDVAGALLVPDLALDGEDAVDRCGARALDGVVEVLVRLQEVQADEVALVVEEDAHR